MSLLKVREGGNPGLNPLLPTAKVNGASSMYANQNPKLVLRIVALSRIQRLPNNLRTLYTSSFTSSQNRRTPFSFSIILGTNLAASVYQCALASI